MLFLYCYIKNCQPKLSFTTAIYFISIPTPSLLISPSATNFLNESTIELTLNDGQISHMSCFVKYPRFCEITFRTISNAENFYYIRFKLEFPLLPYTIYHGIRISLIQGIGYTSLANDTINPFARFVLISSTFERFSINFLGIAIPLLTSIGCILFSAI